MWALILDLSQRQPKKVILLTSHFKRWLFDTLPVKRQPISTSWLSQLCMLSSSSFWTRTSRSNYNVLKFFKTKPLCDFFLKSEMSFQKSVQESFGFSFSKLFADQGELICLLVWSRIIQLLGKRTSALNFASVQISNVKLRTVLSVIYHNKMNTMEQAETNLLINLSFNETFWAELASPWGGHHSKSLKVDKLTRGPVEEAWAFLAFLSHSMSAESLQTAKSRLLPVTCELWQEVLPCPNTSLLWLSLISA